MDSRTRKVVLTLGLSLVASTSIAIIKLIYGKYSHSLAFLADGIHSLYDSISTIVGMASVIYGSQPADEEHPYGHHKFETVSAVILGGLLLLAATEVGSLAYGRILQPENFPNYSLWGLLILGLTLFFNLGIARYEARQAMALSSRFLAADSLHNASDFWITLGVLVSVLSSYLRIPYIDAMTSSAIAVFLIYLSVRLLLRNLKPLVDHSVLDAKKVEGIACSIDGVLYAHQVRSRGEHGRYFLDLNIHLPGKMTLDEAHDITHAVEARLKEEFPGLVDVVIHTEPHGHAPCPPSPFRKEND